MTTTEDRITALAGRMEERARPRYDKGAHIRELLGELPARIEAEAEQRERLALASARAQASAARALVDRPAYREHAKGRVLELATWIRAASGGVERMLDEPPRMRAWLARVAGLEADCYAGYSAEAMADDLRRRAAGWPAPADAIPATLLDVARWKAELATIAEQDAVGALVEVEPTPSGDGVREDASTTRQTYAISTSSPREPD